MLKTHTIENFSSTVLWRIENLDFWKTSLHGIEICSPEFRLVELDIFNVWTMSLIPGNKSSDEDSDDDYKKSEEDLDGESADNFTLCFRSSNDMHSVSFKCEWSLLDSNESPILISVHVYKFPNKDSRGLVPYYPKDKAIFGIRRSTLLSNGTLTVRLRVQNIEEDFDQEEYISAVTRIAVLKESFTWLIERFRTIQLNEKLVNIVKVGDNYFEMNFSFTGESLSEANVEISTVVQNARKQSLNLKIALSDKDEKENKFIEWGHVISHSSREHTFVLPKFISRREILESRSDALYSDNLTLFCELISSPCNTPYSYIESSYHGPATYSLDRVKKDHRMVRSGTILKKQNWRTSNVKFQTSQFCNKENYESLAVLGEDFESFYREQIWCDFELRSGEVSFPVHKMVLCARSPVFKAMFCGDMKKANSKSMDIPDLDVHTLGRMLTFLYAGTIEGNLEWENAAKLFYAADKYQMSSLKRKCFSVLRANVTVSNVSDILELADRHQDQELTSCVNDFIEKHYEEVILSDEWVKFLKRNCLAGVTMMEVYKKKFDTKI